MDDDLDFGTSPRLVIPLGKLGCVGTVTAVFIGFPLAATFTINGLDYLQFYSGIGCALLAVILAAWAVVTQLRFKGNHWTWVCVGLALLGSGYHVWMSGVPIESLVPVASDEADAVAFLEDAGYTEVVIVGPTLFTSGWEFQARRGHEDCRGTVDASGLELEQRDIGCSVGTRLEDLDTRCANHDGEACVAAGRQYASNADWATSTARFLRACSLEVGVGCLEVGVAHDRGERGVARDDDQALGYYRLACRLGSGQGCFNAGSLQGEQTSDTARESSCELYERGCALESARACAQTARCVLQGVGGQPNYALVESRFRSACEAGDPSACIDLGILYANGEGLPQRKSEAAHLFRRGCELGNDESCRLEAEQWMDGFGRATPMDGAERLDGYCQNAIALACFGLGTRLHEGREGVPRNREQARELFDRGCELGDAISCVRFATYLASGDGGSRDRTGAEETRRRACELGHAPACQL
ncbi:MAG: tetratricopeptide repeat protein [Myxococcota bacterium]